MCQTIALTLLKTRHDRILYQILLTLARKYGLTIPGALKYNSQEWSGVGVLENDDAKLLVDVSIPTDRQLVARRPDLILHHKGSKKIWILEVACAWEPLVKEREDEKRAKYQELARDLANQYEGWRTHVVPLVFGALGSLGSARSELESTSLLSAREISYLLLNCQAEVISACVRILKSTLAQ